MSFTVRTQPSGNTFSCEADESILDAALRQGHTFPFGCRSGACGACKGRVVSGSVYYPDEDEVSALAQINRDNGDVILCKAMANSDVVIEVNDVPELSAIQSQKTPAKIHQMKRLSDDVMQLFLKLPEDVTLEFLAGQYINIILEDGSYRSFSLANMPLNDGLLELHIRHIDGGQFTDKVFNELKEQDLLRIEGPLGSFFLREDSDCDLIFVAGGTGFAPVKGIIQHLIAQNSSRNIHLYWGARSSEGLYLDTLAKQWATEHDNIQYTPVISDQEDDWGGAKGFVHQQVMQDYPDLSDKAAYVCGAPAMVKTARQDFTQKGLSETQFFSDVFEFSSN